MLAALVCIYNTQDDDTATFERGVTLNANKSANKFRSKFVSPSLFFPRLNIFPLPSVTRDSSATIQVHVIRPQIVLDSQFRCIPSTAMRLQLAIGAPNGEQATAAKVVFGFEKGDGWRTRPHSGVPHLRSFLTESAVFG